jgi:hypothetical protein
MPPAYYAAVLLAIAAGALGYRGSLSAPRTSPSYS